MKDVKALQKCLAALLGAETFFNVHDDAQVMLHMDLYIEEELNVMEVVYKADAEARGKLTGFRFEVAAPGRQVEVSVEVGGRYWHINGTYDQMSNTHHERPVWVKRDVVPLYIFHTGKTRWVVSKRVDDGSKCYAYVQAPVFVRVWGKDEDTGYSPTKISAHWCCVDSAQQQIQAMIPPPAKDATTPTLPKAEQILKALDDAVGQVELGMQGKAALHVQYGFNNMDKLRQLWKRLDFNGNNIAVSLAEIDKLVVEASRLQLAVTISIF
ncbi:hypothetical protein AK812_SmicGene17636 [Symbiodinium microadriaticum]|uniref:Uncharacterized protein n=1 Tax=Symbiodinium microadriaticum TaxID=2951 RepID=A0A1Q9DX83_SYMMI|nr:hypothetical protein AK812_SmicGene17636 [Symbiodinium microadriaticum]